MMQKAESVCSLLFACYDKIAVDIFGCIVYNSTENGRGVIFRRQI